MTYLVQPPPTLSVHGSIQLNGSKSISNRVLLINALCNNQIDIQNLSNADDTVVMQQLLQSNTKILDAGAGGTTFRFLTAYFATQKGREIILTGSERMQQRPIKILVDALRLLGADIEYVGQEHFPPLRIKGRQLKGGKIELPASTSSQYITALLLIAPVLEEGIQLKLTGTIVSLPYIKMTLKLMEYFGIETKMDENVITVFSGNYQPRPYFVEADWSAASYFYEIAILSQEAEIELRGLTNQQIQGDAVIAKIGEDFGIHTQFNENSIRLIKTKTKLPDEMSINFLEFPDLAQTVLTFSAAIGTTIDCSGLQTLRIKETDRIAALNTELSALKIGSLSESNENKWVLKAFEKPPHHPQHPVFTYEDHRMAMAFAPLCLKTGSIKIEHPEVVSKSYPKYWDDLVSLGFVIKEI
ncbi:MAG TPA: 3-phosphoshikimate 1-carboxyvinyltransferase [Chitinophagales bacterium]|nr:3-phosphoshikimate 1-carboxyvinyltransferase [Chitinophagales bacterium]